MWRISPIHRHRFARNAAGSAQTRLTFNTDTDWLPSWSPDGTKIAFATDRDGNSEIYVMNNDGTEQTNFTNNVSEDTRPSWGP